MQLIGRSPIQKKGVTSVTFGGIHPKVHSSDVTFTHGPFQHMGPQRRSCPAAFGGSQNAGSCKQLKARTVASLAVLQAKVVYHVSPGWSGQPVNHCSDFNTIKMIWNFLAFLTPGQSPVPTRPIRSFCFSKCRYTTSRIEGRTLQHHGSNTFLVHVCHFEGTPWWCSI